MSAPTPTPRLRLRGGLPLVLFLALVIAVPILEVWLLFQVGQTIGVVPTLAILVAEAVLGGWLMRREGAKAWAALNQAVTTGRVPSGELADAALVLVGGVLLMLPGFATDLVGFLFLLPLTRPIARRIVAFFVARRLTGLQQRARSGAPGGEVIEGETVDDAAPPGDDPTVVRGEVTDR